MNTLILKKTAILISIFTIISCTEEKEEKRPNFLFVLADDQSPFDLQVYNAKSILETPNIDKLAREGMVFEGARHMGSWSGAVCTPSRHMIMSGRTLWNLPSLDKKNISSALPDSLENYTLGAVFNKAGYKTIDNTKLSLHIFNPEGHKITDNVPVISLNVSEI